MPPGKPVIALHNRDSTAHILHDPNTGTAATVLVLRRESLSPERLADRLPKGTDDTRTSIQRTSSV